MDEAEKEAVQLARQLGEDSIDQLALLEKIGTIFDRDTPRWAVFGISDWKIRSKVKRLACEPRTRWRAGFIWGLRDLSFRFQTQAIFASSALVMATPSPKGEPWSQLLLAMAIVPLGSLLLFNTVTMAGEVLVGITLMKCGYSRYFHFGFLDLPDPLSRDSPRRKLVELLYFANLAISSLLAISAVLTAYYLVLGGFKGLQDPLCQATFTGSDVLRGGALWVEFFYFATTTFTTVGFGDIYPCAFWPRVIVTAIHFIAFGYVLILLQAVLGLAGNHDPSSDSSGASKR